MCWLPYQFIQGWSLSTSNINMLRKIKYSQWGRSAFLMIARWNRLQIYLMNWCPPCFMNGSRCIFSWMYKILVCSFQFLYQRLSNLPYRTSPALPCKNSNNHEQWQISVINITSQFKRWGLLYVKLCTRCFHISKCISNPYNSFENQQFYTEFGLMKDMAI